MGSRFMWMDDDRDRDLIGGTTKQRSLICMTANEFLIHCGCARCGRRLVQDGKPRAGARMVYPATLTKRTGIGTALCGQCAKELEV